MHSNIFLSPAPPTSFVLKVKMEIQGREKNGLKPSLAQFKNVFLPFSTKTEIVLTFWLERKPQKDKEAEKKQVGCDSDGTPSSTRWKARFPVDRGGVRATSQVKQPWGRPGSHAIRETLFPWKLDSDTYVNLVQNSSSCRAPEIPVESL